MTDCINEEVRDALPDLLHGRLSDLDKMTMTAHVETCADCRAELALMERVRASAPVTPAIDISRIVSMLPAPVPAADQQIASLAAVRQRSPMSMLWKLAAAAALVVAGTLTFSTSRKAASSEDVAPGAVAVTAPAVPSAPAAAPPIAAPAPVPAQVAVAAPVASARASRAKPTGSAGLSLTGGVQDLTDAQLEALLNDVDNVEGLPGTEPEAISISIDGGEAPR